MSGDCLFCRIVNQEIPATVVHEDAATLAFRDIHPQAPTHILIIPKEHISQSSTLPDTLSPLVGTLHQVAKNLAAKEKLRDYRLVINNGPDAGQTVFHLHLHLLGGRTFSWPPG